MSRLEFIKFESEEDFIKAIKALINNETIKSSYTKNDKKVEYNIVHNRRLLLGNNFSLSLSEDEKGQLYLSIDYFSIGDRIKVSKLIKASEKETNLL